MKKVTVYEDSGGGLHKTKEDVAYAEIALMRENRGKEGHDLQHADIRWIVNSRKKLIPLLQMIDQVEHTPL